MDTTLFEVRKGSSLPQCHEDDFDSLNFDTSFQWSDEGIVDSILSSENLDFLPHDLFNPNIILENESAKGDLKFIDEWKHHLQEVPKTSFNLGLDDTTSSLIAEFLHGCDGMKKVPVSLPKIGYTSENNAQIHLKVCDEVMTENGNLFDDQVSRTTLDSALEGLDLTSLLEQFEASEVKCDLLECNDNNHVHSANLSKNVFSSAEHISPSTLFPQTNSSTVEVNCETVNRFQEGQRQRFAAGQLPKFSIILKREPEMVTPEASNPLLEHDYCSRPIQSPPQSSPKIAPPSTAATKCIRKMKSVLKPRTPAKVEIPHVESLYCKLPDYYTSVVPQTDKLDNVSENVTSEKKTYNETCPKSSKAQEYYDKLPQYLTSFVNTVIYSLPKSGDSDTDKGKSRKKDLTKNVSKLKEDASQCKVTKNHSNNVQRIETNKVTSSRNKCCNSPRSRSRKTPLQESSNINWHRKTGFKSNSRNKRYMSSRSPSRSVSSRSQSRSRSRSRERSRSSSSRSSSSSSSSSCSRSPVNKRHPPRNNLYPKYQKGVTYSSSYKYKADSREKWKQDPERRREEEKKKQIEDRRVVHVGNIKPGTTRTELRLRFQIFGPIEDITIHHRDKKDSFGFITFTYTADAFEALEHGNDEGFHPKYELSLGGRRLFCLNQYSDLDSANMDFSTHQHTMSKKELPDFDELLKAAKDNLGPNRGSKT